MVQMQIKFDADENATIGIVMYSLKLRDKRDAVRWIVRQYAEQRGKDVGVGIDASKKV